MSDLFAFSQIRGDLATSLGAEHGLGISYFLTTGLGLSASYGCRFNGWP